MKAKLETEVRRLRDAELTLAAELRAVGEGHPGDHDVFHLSQTLAKQCDAHAKRVGELVGPGQPPAVAPSSRELLDDLRRLYATAGEVQIAATIVKQGAMAAREKELLDAVEQSLPETEVQVKWLKTRIKTAAPQALAAS